MTKLLRNLLGVREPTFSLKLRALESATGSHKVDLSFMSNVLTASNRIIKLLELDPDDTTAQELHSSLLSYAAECDGELSHVYGGDVQKIIDKLESKAPVTPIPIIKSARLKTLLIKNPPKKVMVALGFRSTESLLKRAPLEQLLLGAFMLESVNWHRSFLKSLRLLKPEDITMERPKIVQINSKLLKDARYSQIVALQCAGIIGVPRFKVLPGSFLYTTALISEGLFHLHARGILLKVNRFDQSCVRQIAQYTYTSPEPIGTIGKMNIPWLSCYALIARDKSLQGDISEGVAQASDFFWESPDQILTMLCQKADLWCNTSYLGKIDTTGTVSINITDIAHDLYYRVPLNHCTLTSMRRGINTELLARYLDKYSKRTEILKKVGLI